MWKKILGKGLRSFIDEAQKHIDAFIANRDTDIDNLYFWKSAVIVCEAAINHARRYATLAREMAEAEMRPERKAELLQIAGVCEYVPENPARTFQEALQSMAIIGVCKLYEHPTHNNPQWGRGDQYLYPYFIQDINSRAITLEKAAELDPSSAQARYGLALLYEKAGEMDRAQKAWEAFIPLTQDHALRDMAERHLKRIRP